MKINEINNNWKEFTNTNNITEWYEINDSGSGYETEMMIADFCEYYNYDNEIYYYLINNY